MVRMPTWLETTSTDRPGKKVIVPSRQSDVIVGDRHNRLRPIRDLSTKLRLQWKAMSTKTKMNWAALAGIAVLAGLAMVYINPIFVFALTLVLRSLFYGYARWYVHGQAYEAKVAAKTFAVIQVFAFMAVIYDEFVSQAIWKHGAFILLMFLLTMEVVGVRTWYSKWMERERRQMSQMHPFVRAISPKAGSLFTAIACIVVEYVTFMIMWSRDLDITILFVYHVIIDIIHVVIFFIHHPILIVLVLIALVVVKLRFL